MRNKWLMLIVCGLQVCGLQLVAAEKSRDWQTGQVVESKALTNPKDHAITSAGKTYLVRGFAGTDDDTLAVGATVRFAVEDKDMFISVAGKEYKLYVLGVRTATAKPPAPAPVAAVAPAPTPAPPAPVAAVAPAPKSAPSAPVAAVAPAPPPPPPAPVAAVAPAPPPALTAPRPATPKAAETPTAPPTETPLDNDAVVKMILGGLKEDTVIRVIEARPGKYSLTPDALLGLKAAGVPQSVLTAMSAKMQAQR
jgi:hypothetical protein